MHLLDLLADVVLRGVYKLLEGRVTSKVEKREKVELLWNQ